ncbi:NAD-dependent epimerase/dehydratase family protein [Rubinisphaera italica]|uniref:dTDP-glucose 4,6-dehydratase n=1 Tax=Rubinisphaera italica TaxID=2527969 RepID=A0A5C5XIV1_9PLAN|nr:GDP-mannose 4,6-dehydratase [Rubinisphaera italica]TWT62628.1 dTDP-glucose 4,6-dehydratase [Rubinisphaera italica]
MSRCLITGGAGFIGSSIAEYLLEEGHDVTILDNLSTGRDLNLQGIRDHERLTIRVGSITDSVLLTEVMAGQDEIYHMAAAVGVKLVADDPVRTIETNIYPTELLLRQAMHGGQKVFLASTSEVYGKNTKDSWVEEDDLQFGPTSKPRWAYGCSKAIDEFLALAYHQKYGLPVVIGRFFNVVGPRQVGNYGMVVPRFVESALQGIAPTVYDDGEQVRCFGHVSEVVRCVVGLMRKENLEHNLFNIGSDQPISIRELAERVVALVDPSLEIKYVPYKDYYGHDFEDVRRRVPNTNRLKETLGFKPVMTLDEILKDTIAAKKLALGLS